MRKIYFTAEERKWLKPLLEERIEHFRTVETDVPAKYLDSAAAALRKLIADEYPVLREWEMVMCSSVTSEQLDVLYQTTKLPDAFSLADSTRGYLAQLAAIDLAEGIKLKVGRKKSASTRRYERVSYQEYLARIAKLKESDIIYLSGISNSSPYKIGFVYQNSEVCVFELRRKIELHSLGFFQVPLEAITYGEQNFSIVTTRQQALERFNTHDESEYEPGQLQFLKTMLN